jgi:hypothetical protein
MRCPRRVFLSVLVALALLPAGTRAQGTAQERVRRSMDGADRRIELAETVVSASEDAQARVELTLAKDLQVRARSVAGSGRFSRAGELARQARGHADRAIMLGRGLPTRERLRSQWDRTGELLERSGPRLEECGDARAQALLRLALEMQERARRADEAGRSLGALQLTMGARERCLRALRLCRMEESVQQVAERELSRTGEVLARAREQLERESAGRAATERARDALARATVLQDDASRQFRDGRHDASLQLTLTARRLAHRALGRGPRAR